MFSSFSFTLGSYSKVVEPLKVHHATKELFPSSVCHEEDVRLRARGFRYGHSRPVEEMMKEVSVVDQHTRDLYPFVKSSETRSKAYNRLALSR